MKPARRALGILAAVVVLASAYYVGYGGRDSKSDDAQASPPADPGYSATHAQIIETGDDGRERYRLNAERVHQQTESGVVELERLEMNYQPDAQRSISAAGTAGARQPESWQLKADHGQVRDDGDNVQLNGNVRLTGPAPGSGEPLSLTTENMRINTPTEFIETEAPVRLRWSGHELAAVGLQADLKAGTLRLKSDVHGEFTPK